MRKTGTRIIIAAVLSALLLTGITVLTASATRKPCPERKAQKISTKLPEFEHRSEGPMYEEIYDYIKDNLGENYIDTDVRIPCPIIIGIEDQDPDDIRVYGDFWYYGFDLYKDTMLASCGGSYPGCLHLKKEADGSYQVSRFDKVEDGSGYAESARRIFGKHFHAFVKEQGNFELKTIIRNQIVANYVAQNGLPVTKVKDYGWDAEPLPKENIDSFSTLLN